jgi:methionine sulfoxide reductase catalytic subunit
VAWQYGFASIRSIVRFTFTEARPPIFRETIQPAENGFRANVDPEVPHPRPSQASERVLGTGDRVPRQLFSGDAEFAPLYQDIADERLCA